MSTFITNSLEKSLKRRLRTLIAKSKELKFLVGFFYFSGIKELYETLRELEDKNHLKEAHLKILIGLNVDKALHGIYEYPKNMRFFPNLFITGSSNLTKAGLSSQHEFNVEIKSKLCTK